MLSRTHYAVPLTLVLCGCGSSSSAPAEGASDAETCYDGCRAVSASPCPNALPFGYCRSNCDDTLPRATKGGCVEAMRSYSRCVAQTPKLACDTGGDVVIPASCQPPMLEFEGCIACIAAPDDDGCRACSKQQCCAELTALGEEPTYAPYLACTRACQNSACTSECGRRYATAAAGVNTLLACSHARCAGSCPGPP